MSNPSMLPPLSPAAIGRTSAGNENDLAKNLQLGQVLLAKVLRVYENGSYLVDLNGRQHVVDSTIPLRQEEVFRGKVIGLEERVVLEKMVNTTEGFSGDADHTRQIDWPSKNLAESLKSFVRQHQGLFDVRVWNSLIRTASQTNYPQLVLSASVFLHKIGLPANAELILGLAKYLASNERLMSFSKHNTMYLETDLSISQTVGQSGEAIQTIADYLKRKSEESFDRMREILTALKSQVATLAHNENFASDRFTQDTNQEFEQAAFQWLMNAQLGGAIAHQMVVIPFAINGELVELEMSLFDQKENSNTPSDLKSRLIHLSLNMEHIGKIDAVINVVNQNLRVQFFSESGTGVEVLASHNQRLAAQLQNLAYNIDELTYCVKTPSSEHSVVRPIMDLVSNTNSISMLA